MRHTLTELNTIWDDIQSDRQPLRPMSAAGGIDVPPAAFFTDSLMEVLSVPIPGRSDRAIYARKPGGEWTELQIRSAELLEQENRSACGPLRGGGKKARPRVRCDAKQVGSVARLTIPATYWDDYSERQAVDDPSQMAVEVKRSSNRVTIEADPIQLQYLKADADFYAQGNTDDTPAAVLRGAKRVAELCAEIDSRVKT